MNSEMQELVKEMLTGKPNEATALKAVEMATKLFRQKIDKALEEAPEGDDRKDILMAGRMSMLPHMIKTRDSLATMAVITGASDNDLRAISLLNDAIQYGLEKLR